MDTNENLKKSADAAGWNANNESKCPVTGLHQKAVPAVAPETVTGGPIS